jgi:hypothetical protein
MEENASFNYADQRRFQGIPYICCDRGHTQKWIVVFLPNKISYKKRP